MKNGNQFIAAGAVHTAQLLWLIDRRADTADSCQANYQKIPMRIPADKRGIG